MVAALLDEAARVNPVGDGGWASDGGNRATIILAAVESLANEAPDPAYPGPYVTCFCEKGDLLSQWRGYAGGHGWALGFDAEILGSLATSWDPSDSTIQQITYGEVGISNAVERAVRLIAPVPTGHPGVKGNYRSLVVCRRELARIKHPSFEEEHEWRLVLEQEGRAINEQDATQQDRLAFRDGPVGLTPYLPVRWPSKALREVVIGPTAYPAQQFSAGHRLLGRRGLVDVEIRCSQASYR